MSMHSNLGVNYFEVSVHWKCIRYLWLSVVPASWRSVRS